MTARVDPWVALADAWAAWTRTPSDRGAAVQLTEASRPVAPLLGVPTFRVSTELAEAWAEAGSQKAAIDLLRSRAVA